MAKYYAESVNFGDISIETMKNILRFMAIAVAALAVVCCGSDKKKYLPTSHSGPYEVLVVTPPDVWAAPLGDSLRAAMQVAMPMLNSYEPQFDLSRVMASQYSDYLKRHRNALIVNIGPQYAEPEMVTEYDRYAAPQIILHLTGPDQTTLARYVHDNAAYLRQIFNTAERDRYLGEAAATPATNLQMLVKEKFGFDLSLLRGFTLGNDLDDFLWLRYEHPQSSQGVAIYSYPYSGPDDFTTAALENRRDEFVGLIPGPSDGSYMVTYREMVPLLTHMRIDGRYWAEMRGFWDVQNDFMGGPFVSYSTLDEANNRVVCLDFYVYSPSPQKPKRSLLRQLESIVYSVRFPGDGQAENEVPSEANIEQ